MTTTEQNCIIQRYVFFGVDEGTSAQIEDSPPFQGIRRVLKPAKSFARLGLGEHSQH
jgi:hypothetical protein